MTSTARLRILLIVGISLLVAPLARAGLVQYDLVGVHYDTGMLYRISTADASVTQIGSTGVVNLGSLEFFDGLLYGVTTGPDPTLYAFNLDASVARDPIPLDLTFAFEGGLAISPAGIAYGVSAFPAFNPIVYEMDLSLPWDQVEVVNTYPLDTSGLEDSSLDLNGLSWLSTPGRGSDGTLLGLNGIPAEESLVEITPATWMVNEITPVTGPLGDVGGMALLPDGEFGFFAARPAGGTGDPGTNSLYLFDTSTGQYNLVGGFGSEISGYGFGGLAIVPEPATLLLLGFGGLALTRGRKR